MRSRRREPEIQVKCDYCGEQTETFVATPNHLLFCRIQTVGKEPEKDCMSDYNRSKNVRKIEKEKEQRRLQSNCEKQPEEIKKEKEIRLKNLAKLEAYQKELKLKQWRQRATK